jgi:hypothetical protein
MCGLYTNTPATSGFMTLDNLTEYSALTYNRQSPAPWGLPFLAPNAKGLVGSRQMVWGPYTIGIPTVIKGLFAVDELGFLAFTSSFDGDLPALVGGPILTLVRQIAFYEDTMKGF